MSGLRILLVAICVFGTFCDPAKAQSDFPRVEGGLSVPFLNLRTPVSDAGLGIGAQFAFNATKHFGVDAELDSFPGNTQRSGDFVKRELSLAFEPAMRCQKAGSS